MTVSSLRLPLAAMLCTLASTICLGGIYLTGAWFFPTVGAVLVTVAAAEAARRLSASPFVAPLVGLVGLLLYLLVRYAHDEFLLGLLPTRDAVEQLWSVIQSGRRDMTRFATPIGVSPGIEVLTAGGVGLVALAVDTLAVSWRRAALAGLPLIVLYTVPAALAPDGVGWVAFTVAGAGYLGLLLTESRERLSRWGRPMRFTVPRPNYSPEVETAPLSQVGRRVGATALGLALVVPAVLPDIDLSGLGFGDGPFGSGGGGNKVAVINPIIELGRDLRRPEDRQVIEYRGSPTYLRLVGLDEFTGDQWRPSSLKVSRDDNDVTNGLGRPPGLTRSVKSTSRAYLIRVLDLEQTWLPLPYPATRVSQIEGTWLYDASTFNVFGENSSTRNLTYRVTALAVVPTAEQLRAAPDASTSMSRYLELPDDVPPVVAATARRVVGKATTDYDRALLLQDWFRDPDQFTYAEDVSDTIGDANGSEAIAGFLRSRAGYCVHFASTMSVMARLLGIPARVAVGFTEGSDATRTGNNAVGLHDAHAWPELFFQGVGWVRFEPTPGQRTGDPPSWARAEVGGGDGSGTAEPTTGASASASPGSGPTARSRDDLLGAENRSAAGGDGGGPIRLPLVPTLVVLGLLLLLAVPASTRAVVRRRRWRNTATPVAAATAAWADLQDTLVDIGHSWQASDPPRRGVTRVVDQHRLRGEPVAALHRLADATERARYAPVMPDVGDLRADVGMVRIALVDGLSRSSRLRAWVLPRSTRAVSRAVTERLADGLDAIDAAVAAVTSRLRLR